MLDVMLMPCYVPGLLRANPNPNPNPNPNLYPHPHPHPHPHPDQCGAGDQVWLDSAQVYQVDFPPRAYRDYDEAYHGPWPESPPRPRSADYGIDPYGRQLPAAVTYHYPPKHPEDYPEARWLG